jgi:hypothetical protein
MAEQEQQVDSQENDEIVRIALDYFKKETGSDKKAQEMLGKLAVTRKRRRCQTCAPW